MLMISLFVRALLWSLVDGANDKCKYNLKTKWKRQAERKFERRDYQERLIVGGGT